MVMMYVLQLHLLKLTADTFYAIKWIYCVECDSLNEFLQYDIKCTMSVNNSLVAT